MAQGGFPLRSTLYETVYHDLLVVGTGATVPTVVADAGRGVTLTDQGTGITRISFNEVPGTFVGALASLQATTMTNQLGHVVTFGAFVAKSGTTAAYIDFTHATEGGVAEDLAVLEWVAITIKFRVIT